jgi:hypothetical protein
MERSTLRDRFDDRDAWLQMKGSMPPPQARPARTLDLIFMRSPVFWLRTGAARRIARRGIRANRRSPDIAAGWRSTRAGVAGHQALRSRPARCCCRRKRGRHEPSS